MIGLLKGKTIQTGANPLIVLVGGVGYNVHVPENLLTKTTSDQELTLYIHTHVQQDAIHLYGFTSQADLYMFTMLIGVSGIGPRTGLAIVNRGTQAVEEAVAVANVDFFTTIPRVGRKNAQKIIIELKSKLGTAKEIDLSREGSESKQVIDALFAMGFARSEIMEAMKNLDERKETLEQKIRRVLQKLGKS